MDDGGTFMDKEGKGRFGSPTEVAGQFLLELGQEIPKWTARISHSPDCCVELELEIRQAFHLGADYVVAALLSTVIQLSSFDRTADQVRRSYDTPLAKGRMRMIQIQLIGGLIIWIRSLYCEPRRGWFRETNTEKIPGLHIGLTPKVASQSAHRFQYSVSPHRNQNSRYNG